MRLTGRQKRYIRSLKQRALCGEFPKKLFITSVEECDNYLRSINNTLQEQSKDSDKELLLLELKFKIESKRNFLKLDAETNRRLYYCDVEGWVTSNRGII